MLCTLGARACVFPTRNPVHLRKHCGPWDTSFVCTSLIWSYTALAPHHSKDACQDLWDCTGQPIRFHLQLLFPDGSRSLLNHGARRAAPISHCVFASNLDLQGPQGSHKQVRALRLQACCKHCDQVHCCCHSLVWRLQAGCIQRDQARCCLHSLVQCRLILCCCLKFWLTQPSIVQMPCALSLS